VTRLLYGLPLLAACHSLFGLDELERPVDASVLDSVPDGGPNLAMLEDGFEGALHPRWTRSLENGDACDITTDAAITGTHSLRCRTDGLSGTKAALVLAFEPTTTIRVQMDVRFDARPLWYVAFIQTSHVTATQNTRLVGADYYNTELLDVWNYQTVQSEAHPTPVSLGSWHHVDFRARISSTDGSIALYLDDLAEPASMVAVDTTDLPINQLQIGITLVQNAVETLTVYIDNVVVSEM
jgi:hypothetical protein